jgi:glutamyl-tRNA synthetase
LREIVQRLTLYNALQYGGKARAGSVLGKVLAEKPELKREINPVLQLIHVVVNEVNKLPPDKQRQILEVKWPSLLEEKKAKPEEKRLPPLPNAKKYPFIHLRFCPNPDGALHLGSCRAAVLDDEYVKRYNGRLTLRFDDTDPRTKSPMLKAYDWIREDLKWLGVTWHQEIYQSDRIKIYYAYARHLIESSFAYVCTCKPRSFRSLTIANTACPCRDLPPEEQLDRWNRMLDGGYREREAVVRIKTDLNNPNPAVRDWPALRIIDVKKYPHPRVGDMYRVWPLFAFCCGIDDHELEVSHILRGKEHLTNSVRVGFLYDYLGWSTQEAIHYGRLKIPGPVLSKSKIRMGILESTYSGWDDPRLGTLKALRRRGFLPETIRQFITDLGPKPVDVRVSKIRLHPDYPEKGHRIFKVTPQKNRDVLLVSKKDVNLFKKDKIVRLMELFNIKVKAVQDKVKADYHSETYQEAKAVEAPLIHWIPASTGVKTSVVLSDVTVVEGLAEEQCKTLKQGDVIQFERFGFARIDENDGHLVAYFAHR